MKKKIQNKEHNWNCKLWLNNQTCTTQCFYLFIFEEKKKVDGRNLSSEGNLFYTVYFLVSFR